MNAMEKAKTQVAQTNGTKVVSVEQLIQSSTKQLKSALPAHMNAERLTRIALTTLRLNPKLYQVEPMSFLAALFQSAQLGLEPNINGEAWIIPYTNKGQLVAQFQVGYAGFIKLFWNHQTAVSLQSEVVHKNDTFIYDLGANTVKHQPAPFGEDRGPVIGYYALATLHGGGKVLKVMSKKEATDFAKKFSKCFDAKTNDFMFGTPWKEHFDAMAQKTVLKRLMKLLPKSVEIQKALALDETVKTKIDADMVEIPDETDYKPEIVDATAGPASEAPKDERKVTAVDVAIHDAKKKLGDKIYYEILGGNYGVEHMTELTDGNKELFLADLRKAMGGK